MDFVAVVDQVIALLRQRGRVTYRTLKPQFTLDDAQLTVLKDELLYSQSQVVDDAGGGLVWTGDAGTASLAPVEPPGPAQYSQDVSGYLPLEDSQGSVLRLSQCMGHDASEARWPARWLVDRARACSPARPHCWLSSV
jgi:hypothetical protein